MLSPAPVGTARPGAVGVGSPPVFPCRLVVGDSVGDLTLSLCRCLLPIRPICDSVEHDSDYVCEIFDWLGMPYIKSRGRISNSDYCRKPCLIRAMCFEGGCKFTRPFCLVALQLDEFHRLVSNPVGSLLSRTGRPFQATPYDRSPRLCVSTPRRFPWFWRPIDTPKRDWRVLQCVSLNAARRITLGSKS